MAYKGVKEDFVACSRLQPTSRMPAFALGLEFDYLRAGLTYHDTRTDIEGMVRSQVIAIRDYDNDWALIFPDDYIEFEPLGIRMRGDEDSPAMPAEHLPMTARTLQGFHIPDFQKALRCPVHLEMLRKTKEALGDSALVMGRVAAPFTVPGLIYGIDELMVKLLTEPDLLRDNMQFFIDHQIAFGKAQLEAGADLLWLGDCCAGSKFIRTDHYKEFAFEAAARVAESLVKMGGLLIYHTNETSMPHLAAQVQLPLHAVNVGEGVSIAEVKRVVQPKIALMGNFDWALLRDSTPDKVSDEAERLVRENLPGGGYMFNTGEGVMQNSRPENVAAMMRSAKATAAAVLEEQRAKGAV